jgi:hypothetical protein
VEEDRALPPDDAVEPLIAHGPEKHRVALLGDLPVLPGAISALVGTSAQTYELGPTRHGELCLIDVSTTQWLCYSVHTVWYIILALF